MRRRVLRVVGASVVVAGVVAAFAVGTDSEPPWGGPVKAAAATLQPFGGCDAVLDHFHDQAPDVLIERAGGGRRGIARAMPAMAEDSAASGAEAGGAAGPQHSTTNVQEAGVDEPDLVKTDGRRIVAVAQERVRLIDADRGEMTLRRTLPEGNVRNVFLSGDRLLLFSGPEDYEPGWAGAGQQAELTLYDVADFAAPRRVASLTIDGDVLDARLVGTQVRVATVAAPEMDTPSRAETRDGRPSWRWKEAIRDAVAATAVDDWLPAYTLRDGKGRQLDTGRLVDCADLTRPEHFSGLDTVAVTTFDLSAALQDRTSVGVIAGGEQIYATDTSTYVSTTEWDTDDATTATSLHKFVTAKSGDTAYRGSGEVPGRLLNSYALSEHDGVLRAATTVSGSGGRSGWGTTEGVVTTLGEQDGELRRLGQVDGLGREDNESIMAVRFIEDRGYVVTFRQTDPLYVLDLADPAAPRTVGELKIPGYSGYLHPLGADRMLGVGQSGAGGVQFSLFDIADPADPRRVDTQSYGSGAAGAEFDPRAFLYWEPRRLVVAPLSVYESHQGRGPFNGLVLLQADADGLTEVDRVSSTGPDDMAQRSVVIDDAVYLLSSQALQSSHLDTHQGIDRLVF